MVHWMRCSRAAQNEHLFGVRDTEFDFSKRDLKRAAAELDTLRTEQRDRQKTINKKAVQMYDKVEQDYRDLVDKKEQVWARGPGCPPQTSFGAVCCGAAPVLRPRAVF